MVRIAIADDEIEFAKRAEEITVRFFRSQRKRCETVIYQKPRELLWDIEDGYSYDIYLIDIEMPEISGMDLAHAIRQKRDDPYIIFVTSHVEYSIKGYEYNAWRYIMKSEMENNLLLALDSMMKRWEKEPENFYVFKTQTMVSKVMYSDIYYLHKDGKYTYFYTAQGIYKERSPLTRVLENLDSTEFVFSHRAYIVNLKHVIRLKDNNNIVMRDGTEIPSGSLHFQHVKEAINNYWS